MKEYNELINEIKEQCGDCEAWSGTDCTRNPYTQGCLKDKKKLTDEEIVKALEICAKELTCTKCPYRHECCSKESSSGLLLYGVDLIHRLQSDIERIKEVNAGLALANLFDLPPNEDCLTDNEFEVARKTIATQKAEIERLSLIAGIVNKGVAVEIVNMQETIDKQQAEIERLTRESDEMFDRHAKENQAASFLIEKRNNEIERLKKEHERIAWSKQEYLEWVHGFLSTHTEMKYRGEKYEMFDRDWMCNVFWAKIKGSIEYIIDLENQRNELQKQVDELTAFKNEAISMSLYGKGRKDGEEVAVKDTAEKFAERVKMAFYYEFDELIPSIMADKIDEICKEITEGK